MGCATEGLDVDRFEHEYRKHGTDWIDDYAFPAEDGADLAGRFNEAEEWADDGRAGDEKDAAEQNGERPLQIEDPMRG